MEMNDSKIWIPKFGSQNLDSKIWNPNSVVFLKISDDCVLGYYFEGGTWGQAVSAFFHSLLSLFRGVMNQDVSYVVVELCWTKGSLVLVLTKVNKDKDNEAHTLRLHPLRKGK